MFLCWYKNNLYNLSNLFGVLDDLAINYALFGKSERIVLDFEIDIYFQFLTEFVSFNKDGSNLGGLLALIYQSAFFTFNMQIIQNFYLCQ